MLKIFITISIILLYSGCSSKDAFYKSMYDGYKMDKKHKDTKYKHSSNYDKSADDDYDNLNYKEYKQKVQQSKF